LNEQKKMSLTDLLKSLEGHIVDSVEIKGEDFHLVKKISSNVRLEILHVKISTIPRSDASYPSHETLDPKDLAFSIMDADDVGEGMIVIHTELQEIVKKIHSDLTEILSNLEKRNQFADIKNIVNKLLHQKKGNITEYVNES